MTLDELRSIAPLADRKNRLTMSRRTSLSLPSFAKINLDLRVLGTRPDGYHDLRTVFQSLALFDNVTVTRGAARSRSRATSPTIPTDRRNLVWKAASLLYRTVDRRPATRRATSSIDLRKRVPPEAGLGGGSSNAAMTLLALEQAVEARSRSRRR